MQIVITKRQAEQIGYDKFTEWGFDTRTFRWGDAKGIIHIRTLKPESLQRLQQLLLANANVYGCKSHLKDIALWRETLESGIDEGTIKVPSVKMFEVLLTAYMLKVPGQRVYKKHNEAGGDEGFHAYYLNSIVYHPPVHHKATKETPAWTTPDYVSCDVDYETYEGKGSESLRWYREDVRGKTVANCLTDKDYFPETEELRAAYVKQTERFQEMFTAIGRQYVANGDAWVISGSSRRGNDDDDNRGGWWRRSHDRSVVALAANTRVVIDVVNEAKDGAVVQTDSHRTSNTRVVKGFWRMAKQEIIYDEDDDAEETREENRETPIEIPIHPYLVVFNLAKHMRLKLHASQLHRYKYDTKLIHKLILDDTRKALVKLLIQYRDSKYEDIIGSKSGGAIILLCGTPGTGKTLTAEVFAESEKRPLYSVQCAQLGTTPEELEDELLKIFARAARWNAVLFLDEADVYVHRRGSDIQQNAIVGVFLRLLEYQNAVMFLATNRSEDIDDAIASRCTARLIYTNPSFEDQCKIWRVLVDTAQAKMSNKAIARVAKAHPDLSGRDVKNLVKLAMLVSDKKITSKTITFVKQFKPT